MDAARERALLAKYPFHIYLMVKMAEEALTSGKARIENGVLVMVPERPPPHSVDSSPTGR